MPFEKNELDLSMATSIGAKVLLGAFKQSG